MATITRACVILWYIKSNIECKLNTLFGPPFLFSFCKSSTSDIRHSDHFSNKGPTRK